MVAAQELAGAGRVPHERFGTALGLWVVFVVYGSLLPFEHRALPLEEAWARFMATPYLELGPRSRADWMANLLFYIPIGFLGTAWLGRGRAGTRAALTAPWVLLGGAVLALGVEFAQLFFPPRTVSRNDLLAEGLGLAVGAGLWVLAGARLEALWGAVRRGGRGALQAALGLYLLGYLALALIPFDFVLSWAELGWKAEQSGVHGVLLAAACGEGLRCGARLGAEVLATVPLGLLLALVARRRMSYASATAAGGALGFAIEAFQFLLVSGVAQGASVLTRLAGGVAGVGLARTVDAARVERALPYLRPAALVLLVPYLASVALLHGWHGAGWVGLDQALEELAGLRFIPFYYHYYTSEPVALRSVVFHLGLYAPVGLAYWGWVRGVPGSGVGARSGAAAVLGVGLALVVEGSKLFLSGERPDPTNLLIAALGAGLACAAAEWALGSLRRGYAARVPRDEGAVYPGAASPQQFSGGSRREGDGHPDPLARAFSVAVLGAAAWGVAGYPLAPVWLAVGLAAYGVFLWWRPGLWLVAVPALLPVLDLAPWSGRLFFGAWDLCLLVTVGVLLWREPVSFARLRGGAALLGGLLVFSYAIATVRGLLPLEPLDANAFESYYSNYNSLRVAKGFVWALVLLPFAARALAARAEAPRRFALGVALGLAATALWVAWERHVFTGLFDFGRVFRVTGPFSGMHVGGVAIEAYLVAALPFAFFWLARARGWAQRAAAALLVGLGAYALLVTFARSGYAALVASLLVLGALGWHARRAEAGKRRWVLALSAGAAVCVLVALAAWKAPYMGARFEQAGADLQTRARHYEQVLGIRDRDWATRLFGMGLGTFPETYFWRAVGEELPGTYRYVTEEGNTYLALGGGDPLYLRQRIPLEPGTRYTLSLRLRSTGEGGGALRIFACEQALLYAGACRRLSMRPPPAGEGWAERAATFDSAGLAGGPWHRRRPTTLSLLNAERDSVVAVDDVRLVDEAGRNLVRNGDFSRGGDFWFFAADRLEPWHVENLWLAAYFERGWLGVVALGGLLLCALVRLVRATARGDELAPALGASLAGTLVVGLTGSPLDFPRIATLFFLVAGFSLLLAPAAERRRDPRLRLPARGRRPRVPGGAPAYAGGAPRGAEAPAGASAFTRSGP